ncbi:MAG: DUF255 domain-containing protein [Planctomycetaceae bacterium]|jgi:YHS domain-containing protein/thioredoxin-related protein|nr:DUF255 domain-containing protein [Planctomycetaceae bacterium]
MRKRIITNIYRGNFCAELFSKAVFAVIRISVLAVVLSTVLLSANRQLSAQVVESINWNNDFKRACQIAQVENRLVIVHFYSDCAPCTSMNANVFTDPRIAIEMNRNFVVVRADMKTQSLLAQQFNVTVVPTDLVIKPDGQVVYRRQGEIVAEKYLQFLQYLRNNLIQPNSATSHLATIPANNVVTKKVTNNTTTPVVNVNAPTAATPFPSQPEKNSTSNVDSQNNFAFINNTEQSNQPVLPSNSPNHFAANSQPVISASGQIEPNKTGNNTVTTIPSTNGITSSNTVPFNTPNNTDKNTIGNNITKNTVDGKEPVADNANNNLANNKGTVKPDSDKPDYEGFNPNKITVTNNPMFIRNPVVDNQTEGNTIETSGHLMVEVPLAIEGYCPVVLCKKEEWIPGNPAYYAMYRGQVYRFSSQEAMAEFLKTPLKFAPVAMGEDVVMMIDRNKKICGSRKYGVWFGGRVYLFASKESLNSFIAKPEHYANIAQNYEAAFKSPLDTVQR